MRVVMTSDEQSDGFPDLLNAWERIRQELQGLRGQMERHTQETEILQRQHEEQTHRYELLRAQATPELRQVFSMLEELEGIAINQGVAISHLSQAILHDREGLLVLGELVHALTLHVMQREQDRDGGGTPPIARA